MAGVGAGDIDVAQIYDHFTSQVIMQIEDYGLCAKGEGGPFVARGATRNDGSLPVTTDGWLLECGYIWGMAQVRDAVGEKSGVDANQHAGDEKAMGTRGPVKATGGGRFRGG